MILGQRTKGMNKKVVSVISVVVLLFGIFLFDRYYSDASVLAHLSKWNRIGILSLSAVTLSCLINVLAIKIWSALSVKREGSR